MDGEKTRTDRKPSAKHDWWSHHTTMSRPRWRAGTARSGTQVARWLLLCLVIIFGPIVQTESVRAADAALTFSISADVPEEDAAYVEEGLVFARRYLEEVMGDVPEIELAVNVRHTDDSTGFHATAFFSPGFMVFFTASPGWSSIAPVDRFHVVVHEYIHAYQYELLGGSEVSLPAWLIEGIAEYLGYDAVDDLGVIDARDVHDFHAWSISNGPEMRDLKNLEPRDTFYSEPGPVYSLGYLAVDHFMDGRPPEALDGFMRAVGKGFSWEQAFAGAFGVEIDDFYRSFAASRSDLIAPRESPDPFLYASPEFVESPVTIESTSSPVVVGDQLIVIAHAEAGAICEIRLRGDESEVNLKRASFADGAGTVLWLVTVPESANEGQATVTASCGAKRIATQIELVEA